MSFSLKKAASEKRMGLIEEELYFQGELVAGVDEVGRGPLAGPVFAAACILPPNFSLPGLKDSKALTEEIREALCQAITDNPSVIYSFVSIGVEIIDKINILQASLLAMKKAVEALKEPPTFVLVDGNQLLQLNCPMKKIVKGKGFYTSSTSIAAASIIAKVKRDKYMKEVAHRAFPEYGFAMHKGYGTKKHKEALEKYGPSPFHRKSFAPMKKLT